MSKIYSVASSIVARCTILSILFIYTIMAFYSSRMMSRLLTNVAGDVGLVFLLEYVCVPTLVAAVFLVSVKRGGVFNGFVGFSAAIIVGFNVFMVAGEVSLAILAGSSGLNTYRVLSSIVSLIIALFLSKTYSTVALSFRIVDQTSGLCRETKGVNVEIQPIEAFRLIIHGDYRKVALKANPPGSFRVSDFIRTPLYTYVDVVPLSSTPGSVDILFEGKLVSSLKISLKNPSFKRIVFSTYFNDDFVGTYDLNVEVHKQLIEAAQPVVSLIFSKLGVSMEEVKEIQFYTKDNVYIPPSAKVSDLLEVEELLLKIYSTEKFAEFLKFMKRTDVYELWDTLVKRLEALRLRIPGIVGKARELREDYEKIISNWW